MKSIIEGERALCFWLSQQTEVSLNHPDEKTRQEASDYVSLMTPVVKSLFTDLAMEITSDAMQIHGGYGYTKDQGIEQLYRDNRITPIYEGTNSVQAADLVFRKLINRNGDVISKFLEMIKSEYVTKKKFYFGTESDHVHSCRAAWRGRARGRPRGERTSGRAPRRLAQRGAGVEAGHGGVA